MYQRRGLSLNKKKIEDPNELNLNASDRETYSVAQHLESAMETKESEDLKDLTQVDLRSTSLKLNFKKVKENSDQGNTTKESDTVKKIEEIFSNRHHVATLLYSLESSRERNVVPRFMHTSVDFYPYFGSSMAKDFFKEKLKTIRSKVNELVIEKVCQESEELINTMTSKAEYLKMKFAEAYAHQLEQISNFQAEITKLLEKYDKEFENFTKEYEDKLSRPIKEPEKKNGPTRERKDRFRNGPYTRK